MTSGRNVLFITNGKSPLKKNIPEKINIHTTALSNSSDFIDIPKSLSIILIDLENEEDLLNKLLILKDYSPLQKKPIWGFLQSKKRKVLNLFLLFGGTKTFNLNELEAAFKNGDLPSEESSDERQDIILPPITNKADGFRLAGQLNRVMQEQTFNSLYLDSESYSLAMKTNLETIFELINPHLAIILINDNQRATGFIKPALMIFEQDYKDFMNFCLNDFFIHFSSLNLEDIKETFFTGRRDDFNKINMNRHKLSSYIYFPILNHNGDIEATLHLGHLLNNYFSDKIVLKIENFIKSMSGNFFLALRTYQAALRQEKILHIFKRFVPAEIIPELIQKEHKKEKELVKKSIITVLFSDIRSFTSITEQNNAQGVVDFLNTHFEAMVSIIKKHGGTIDKFIGDAIVALFGEPNNFEDNSARAAKAAVEMIEKLSTIDCSNIILNEGKYNIGIGIHEGPAIIGNVGSEDKADYTAIGNVIGIAEELEALTKNYSGSILISNTANNSIGERLSTTLIDTISLGKEKEMKIYSPSPGGTNGN